jgi:hypothetical protein
MQFFGLPFCKFVKLVVLAIIQKLCFMVSTLNRAVGYITYLLIIMSVKKLEVADLAADVGVGKMGRRSNDFL